MDTPNRGKVLLEVLRQGLERYGQRQTQTMLGDRTAYIGMSDIGRYAECPRAALAGKLLPPEASLERLLTLQRGHWFEDGVGQCLHALGLHVLPQLEIRHVYQGASIRAHLDFTLVWEQPRPAVRILEVKSMEQLPADPYAAHELQISGQLGLLCRLWNKPAFSLRDADGRILHDKLTFPQICRAHLCLALPDSVRDVSLEGWLLCLSMKEARAFGPYGYDAELLANILTQARAFWAQLQDIRTGSLMLDVVPHAQGFHPLCACCRFNADCPKFPQGDYQPQWQPALTRLEALKQNHLALDAEIREMEAALKLAHSLSGTRDWINAGQHRFRLATTAGRRSLNKAALFNELTEIFRFEKIEDIDVDALLFRCEREGASASRLIINTIS
ncbi:hypothetical protein [uncultured Desulfovibrio sp.]|uniref:hypothetical protein n=1 Tax=uncultured Desulfovibrio sp. TaxID=167968 RepID=UPI002671BAAC|nr:hypothetical protein [uncultured Desulfovibrio sp.]